MEKIYKNLTDAEWDILTSREVSVAELRTALESVAEDDNAFNSKSLRNDIEKVFREKDPKTITMDIYVGGDKVVSDTKDINHDYMSYDSEGNEYHDYAEADIDSFIGQSRISPDNIYYSKDDHPIFDNEYEVLLTIFSESVCSEDMTIIVSTDSGAVYEFNHSLTPWYYNLINIIKK